MRLLSYSGTQNKFTGTTKEVVVDLLSSEVPETFPTTGEGINGMGANYKLMPGSTMYIVHGAKLYMMDESFNWIEQ